jgi:ribose transport system permease protein
VGREPHAPELNAIADGFGQLQGSAYGLKTEGEPVNKTLKTTTNVLKALILPAALYALLLLLIPDRVGNLNSLYIMLSISVIPTITACGVSFGWISGIMDFSIGSVVIFSSILGAVCGNFLGVPGLFLGAVLSALVLSALVGGAFRLLRIPSLVVSLGMLLIFEIAANQFVVFMGKTWPEYSTGYYIQLKQSLTVFGTYPWNFVLLVGVLIVYSVVFYYTKFSNQARVVGSDELIARNVGIKPMKVKFATYLVGGFFLGIAAAITAAYSGSATPQIGMSTLSAVFRPMMGVVIALALQKLVPIPLGIFIGVFSLNIIFTGVIALGWSDNLQNVLLGIFLIIVLGFPKVWADISRSRQRKAGMRAQKSG